MPRPEAKPVTSRPAHAVTALTDQLQHPSDGVRKAAARSIGRLGEAAVRRGLAEAAAEHASVLAELHLDPSASVREVAFSALAQVRKAAAEHSGACSVSEVLSEQLRLHAATRFYRIPASEPEPAEKVETPAQRFMSCSSSSGCLARPSSSGTLSKALSASDATLFPARRSARPGSAPMSRQAASRARAFAKEESKADTREVLHILHRPVSAAADKEEAGRLALQLADADASTRAAAAMALGHMGEAACAHAGTLIQRLTDTDSFVRAAAAVSLGKLPKSVVQGLRPSRSPKRRRRRKVRNRSPGGPSIGARSAPLSGGGRGPNSLARAASPNRRPHSAGAGRRPASASRARRPQTPLRAQRPRSAGSNAASRSTQPAWSGVASPASMTSSQNLLAFGSPNSSIMQNFRKPRKGAQVSTSSTSTLFGSGAIGHVSIRCCCGLDAVRQQARNGGPNEGRFFFGCPQEKGMPRRCDFVLWEPD